jgi:hypothetical protein
MARTASDIGVPSGNRWPPTGKRNCICIEASKQRSKQKKTPCVHLKFRSFNGEYEFSDDVWVVAKGLKRLNLVAQRLCNLPEEFALPDDDLEAARLLANYIHDNAKGKRATITIEENEEKYMVESGPEKGLQKKITRKRVAFAGYDRLREQEGESTQDEYPTDDSDFGGEDVPF